MSLKRAVFLDRDGTINEECSYLFRVQDCRFIPGAIEAIALLNRAGFTVVVVTNQSGIARGYYTEADLEILHDYMDRTMVSAGGKVSGWYYCPHHPDYPVGAPACDCRKPLPGLLQIAAEDLGIDLGRSWMVGDKIADIEAGYAAGCRSILVRTGYGGSEAVSAPRGVTIVADLLAAAEHIIQVSSEGVNL